MGCAGKRRMVRRTEDRRAHPHPKHDLREVRDVSDSRRQTLLQSRLEGRELRMIEQKHAPRVAPIHTETALQNVVESTLTIIPSNSEGIVQRRMRFTPSHDQNMVYR